MPSVSEICALLKGKFMGGDENGPESPQGRRGNMSLAEKMEMWHQEFSQEHSVFREDAPSKFEGVDDLEDDDPVSNSELSLYSKIILKSSAYRWLVSTLQTQASLCYGDGHSTMAGDEIRQMVLKQLQTGTISKKQPPRTFATCFVLPGYWNTLRSRLNFYDANGQTIRLQNIVVLSVSSDTDAQIATAGHYMRQMWQDAGTLLLQGFQDLVDGRIGECIEVQVHDTAYIKIQIIGSDVNVVCHGPAYFAAQCAAQLCWIDCAIQPNRPLPVVRTPCLTQIGAAKFLISSLDETTKRHKVLAHIERTNTCWQRFDPLVCVWGFPIARRPEGFSGVELPLSPANNSLFLSPDLSLEWPVKRLVLNQWAATLCCVGRINSSWLWHLERTCTCSAEWMENYSGDLHRLTIDDIARDQHILGYCNETSGLLNNRQDETARGQESNSNKESIETVINTPLMKSLDCNSFTTHDAQSDSVDTDLLSISSFSCDIDDDALQLDKCATPIIDIVALQLVSKIACRQAPTLEKPLCDQESMSNAQGTASISTQGIQRGSPNSAPNPGKRKASDQDEGDDGEEPSQNRRPEKRSARGEGSSRQQTFACPFWKRDPIKHRTCFHAKLLTSSRVKQHLSRSHTPRFYCQLCFAVFKEEQAQEQHVIQRSCIRVPGMQLDGISPDQQLQLSRKPKLTLTEEERWYRIWDIVLPHDPRPKSPYIDSQLSDCCARFREHWQNLGPELLLREIQSSGVLASAAMDEATTARLLRRILARGLDMIWESWAPPSSSIIQQNLLQQLPATPAYTQEHNSLGPVSSTTSTSSIVDVAPEIHGNLHITPWVGTHHQRVPETPDLSTTGTYTVSQMVFSNPSASEMVQRLEQTIESTNMLDFDDADILDSSHDFGADIGDIGSWVDL
ncbi:hypothetical protein PFICI_10583 [Pestalotiopsis fici W106-1]|uniref:C2H2-type domain-containing protein n=1 Tax=Pestalotiopsis fici (strain W106-1 / CGMCC3.15140) TaxID=1229662 RepID=W3X047_PESFW|nr:uncharacterized protein PFICI_10583 [Pestalotiopsis fici W106-1]ETS78521.1 hypothetical protein PFICI_10583 [Pestalotiopsis fici W106-1]